MPMTTRKRCADIESVPGPLNLMALVGQIRPLEVTTAQRTKSVYCTPAVAESGLPDYEVPFWLGLSHLSARKL